MQGINMVKITGYNSTYIFGIAPSNDNYPISFIDESFWGDSLP